MLDGLPGGIYNELWGYYLVTGDREFLRTRLTPALKEIALFFEDYACDRDEHGRVIFYPSFSPENPSPAYKTVNCSRINPTRINSVMDIAICREVLENLIAGCRELWLEEENIPHWEGQLASLPVYLLDEEGSLKEWAWPSIEENHNHRHVSHHYDVWPGCAVTPDNEPELARATVMSNRKRGQQDDSAHGIIHRSFTAIRLKNMEETLQNMSQLTSHGFVRRTLQTSHYPYRVGFPDLTGAVPALLIEMCVFSMPGEIEFPPCMPETLMSGSIEGVWLYTFAKMKSMTWRRNGAEARIASLRDQCIRLRCRKPGAVICVNGQPVPMENGCAEYRFAENEEAEITLSF